MKRFLHTFNVLVVFMLSTQITYSQVTDSSSMGPGYINDVFYSLENGVVESSPRDTWDIAFFTPRFSAGIMVNDGLDVKLYTYPKADTSGWASIDTVGLLTWPRLYNSPEEWEEGAFNRNSTGHPDYGWGWYNMSNHHIYGDSIYILDIPGAGLKKLWIIEKKSIDNIYIFKYADLDGTKENEVELDVSKYEDKRFIYYSLVNDEYVDREPVKESWDVQFTRYFEEISDNEGNVVNYPVTGVASNIDIGANHFYPVSPDFADWSSEPFDSTRNVIGHDWKSFDFSTGWIIADSNIYFVQNYKGDVYKLVFTYWSGATAGDFAVQKELISLVSVDEFSKVESDFIVYPNPATSLFTIKGGESLKGAELVTIYDQSGRIMYQQAITLADLEQGLSIENARFAKGLYIVNISGSNLSSNQKLMVR